MGKKRGPTPRDFFCIREGLSKGFALKKKSSEVRRGFGVAFFF
jgi:hypothetical protein